jgi:uncharacterized integral membrane protein
VEFNEREAQHAGVFLAALGIALVAVPFALQNNEPVRVSFLAWTFRGSLAVVLFVALILGALVSALISVPGIVRSRWTAVDRRGIASAAAARENAA